MKSFNMFLKVILSCSFVAAQRTGEGLRFRVHSEVSDIFVFLVALKWTLGTSPLEDTLVTPFAVVRICERSELFATQLAAVLLLPGVPGDVELVARESLETGSTHLAHERLGVSLICIVLPLNMLGQTFHRQAANVTWCLF